MRRTLAHYWTAVVMQGNGAEGDIYRAGSEEQARDIARATLALPGTTAINIVEVTIPVGAAPAHRWVDVYTPVAPYGVIAYRVQAMLEMATPPDTDTAYPVSGPNEGPDKE